MTGPRTLREMAGNPRISDETRAGILAGLLVLGDRRTLPYLRGCWRLLPPLPPDRAAALTDPRMRLTNATTGVVHASHIEFFLDWLEDADESEFGAIAGALVRLARASSYPKVVDIQRRFPATPDDENPVITTLAEWTFNEYGQLIAPRLLDLGRRENEPKVLPVLLEAWGIET